MPDLFLVDDLDGAVMPSLTICHSTSCQKRENCQRSFKHWPGKLGDPQQSFINPEPASCSAYYPIPKVKTMAGIKQEPLPDKKISGKMWHMWQERHGKVWMAFAFRDNITHSFATQESMDAAVVGCVAQVERIYGKPIPKPQDEAKTSEGQANG